MWPGKPARRKKRDEADTFPENIIRRSWDFPADKPALCIYVALDEPTGDYYGGLTAAPIFKAIAERSASYLGIKPDLVEQGSMVSNNEGP